MESLPGELIARFLRTYYAPLNPKPEAWSSMVEAVAQRGEVALLPL
jgi:hypothetical protein